ncbi:MAG: chorismate synthase [Chloroflexi bacterium]|nr:chorismate synthase [Chloroflexota bacterium]
MLRFLTAGESHGSQLTAILDGLVAGVPLSSAEIDCDLAKRQVGYGAGPRMKIETDQARITGGVLGGHTTGAPIALTVDNLDHAKWADRDIAPLTIPRPGHADLTGAIKYGYKELRLALERASARETAARVAVGAICRKFLGEFGIVIGSYVTSIGAVDANVSDEVSYLDRFAQADQSDVRCPDADAASKMHAEIRAAMEAKDTLGGITEVVALHVPPGLGTHVQWDRRLSARLIGALSSVHAMKGVEIGSAFENAHKRGTQVHDEILRDGDRIVRATNRAGGFEGGITTGEPIVARVAMKPISTTLNPLRSIDLATGEETRTTYERSDFCATPRAGVILEAMMAFVLADALIEKLGGDSLSEMKPRFETLRRARLEDLVMDNVVWKF